VESKQEKEEGRGAPLRKAMAAKLDRLLFRCFWEISLSYLDSGRLICLSLTSDCCSGTVEDLSITGTSISADRSCESGDALSRLRSFEIRLNLNPQSSSISQTSPAALYTTSMQEAAQGYFMCRLQGHHRKLARTKLANQRDPLHGRIDKYCIPYFDYYMTNALRAASFVLQKATYGRLQLKAVSHQIRAYGLF